MDILKESGLKVVKVNGDFVNHLTGRNNGTAKGLVNAAGEYLHMDGVAYFPLGGRSAFISIIEQKCLESPSFSFKPF